MEIVLPSANVQWQMLVQLLNIVVVVSAVFLAVRVRDGADARRARKVLQPLLVAEIGDVLSKFVSALRTPSDPVVVRDFDVSRPPIAILTAFGEKVAALPEPAYQAVLDFYTSMLAVRASHSVGLPPNSTAIALDSCRKVEQSARNALAELNGEK
jgi:hypothetical protein